jgi:hypothetical protein
MVVRPTGLDGRSFGGESDCNPPVIPTDVYEPFVTWTGVQHHGATASASAYNNTNSHRRMIETRNLVTVNANACKLRSDALALAMSVRDAVAVGVPHVSPAAPVPGTDSHHNHNHATLASCGGDDRDDDDRGSRCCYQRPAVPRRGTPSVSRTRSSWSSPIPLSHPTVITPCKSSCDPLPKTSSSTVRRPRRSPLVEVKIWADLHRTRKETVIAGWVHCDEERIVSTDLSCEDSECDYECQCFTLSDQPSQQSLQQQQQQPRRRRRLVSSSCQCHHGPSPLDDPNSSQSLMTAFMFTKRKPFLAEYDGDGIQIHAPVVPDQPLLYSSINHEEGYTDTESESETSYEGDDEESIT